MEILYRIARAEAGGTSEEGITNVVWVILNRVKSEKWPNTIAEVVFQPGQFTRINMSSKVDPFVKSVVDNAYLNYYLHPEMVHNGMSFHASGSGIDWSGHLEKIDVDEVGHHIYADPRDQSLQQ